MLLDFTNFGRRRGLKELSRTTCMVETENRRKLTSHVLLLHVSSADSLVPKLVPEFELCSSRCAF